MGRNKRGSDEHVFLTPRWIEEVRRVVEAAKQADLHFRLLVNDFTMNVKYVIRDLPEGLRRVYGGKSEAAVYVRLHEGSVQQIRLGRKPARQEIHLVVTIDYHTAKQLFLGHSSPARVVISRRLKARPVNGFRHWHKVAARSIVTANRVLRTARKVPTAFDGG